MTNKTISSRIPLVLFLSFSVLVTCLPSAMAVPGGGVWLQNGTVILWKNTIEEYTDEYDAGYPEWISRHVDFLRFKAETVTSSDSLVNVTGSYYTYNGNLQPAPDYQNHPDFVPWHDNLSYYVNSTATSKYQSFWNSLDASLEDLTTVDDILNSLLVTVVLVWLKGEEYEIENATGDIDTWDHNTVINDQGERWVNYTFTITHTVKFEGTYPTETNAWGNSTFVAVGLLQYGDDTNVLRKHDMLINYGLVLYNNDTKTHDTDQKLFRHTLMVQYPSDVVEDTSVATQLGIPGFNLVYFLMMMGVSSLLLVHRQRTKKQ